MVTIISMLVSTIFFLKLILSRIELVHYLTSTLYVVAIIMSDYKLCSTLED